MTLILSGKAAPDAIGALLMVMRLRGETDAEIAGFTAALRATTQQQPTTDLDWPCYAADRTRGASLFLLAAKLVTRSGYSVTLHGWNSHQGTAADLRGLMRDRANARLAPRARRGLWRWVFTGPAREAHARGSERAAAQMIKQATDTATFGSEGRASVAMVGAGPGAKDRITMRDAQRLQEADVVFYDSLIDPEVLDPARRDAERVYVGKSRGCHDWPQGKISGVLVAAAQQGKRVVHLKYGDPGVHASGVEGTDALNAAGIAYEIVPGITATSAAVLATGRSEIVGKTQGWVKSLHLEPASQFTWASDQPLESRRAWPLQVCKKKSQSISCRGHSKRTK